MFCFVLFTLSRYRGFWGRKQSNILWQKELTMALLTEKHG